MMNSMGLYCKALLHMTAWGGLGGLLTGAIFGSFLFPIIGTLYGASCGFFAGMVLGLPSGLLVGYLTQRYVHSSQEQLDYGLKLGAAVAIFVMTGAWVIFSSMFRGWPNWIFPGIPSLIAGTTAAYASKRFAQRCLDGDFVFEKPKRREFI